MLPGALPILRACIARRATLGIGRCVGDGTVDLADWLWVATTAYAVHILEEFTLDWQNWASRVLGLPVVWPDFYVANSIVIVAGIAAANLALAALALGFPALMLINAVLFHIVPMVRKRGRFSPGAITAVILFLPIGVTCFVVAGRSGLLSAGTAVGASVLGAALMATPIVLLKVKSKPYFLQDRA